MKRLLMAAAAVAAFAVSPALADSITLTATCDGVACGAAASADGSLNVSDQAFGIFNLNSLTINTQTFLAPPSILQANTLDVDQGTSGNHTLVLDIVGHNLAGPNSLTALLSSFSVSGQTAGWTIQAQTLINGAPLATSNVFTGVSDSGSSLNFAFLGTTFDAEAIFSITSSGIGSVNSGVLISTAVPEPATWGMMLLGFLGLGVAFRNRRRMAGLMA